MDVNVAYTLYYVFNFSQSSQIRDPCFNPYPNIWKPFTGTTGVGYQLWAGLQCEFRVAYRTERGRPTVKSSYCTVKSKQWSVCTVLV